MVDGARSAYFAGLGLGMASSPYEGERVVRAVARLVLSMLVACPEVRDAVALAAELSDYKAAGEVLRAGVEAWGALEKKRLLRAIRSAELEIRGADRP